MCVILLSNPSLTAAELMTYIVNSGLIHYRITPKADSLAVAENTENRNLTRHGPRYA